MDRNQSYRHKGKPQEVKIFFGEYADNGITAAAKWFSDLKDFSLALIGLDRKEIRLSATAKDNYYTAQFIPPANGVYTLVMHHIVKDVYGTMKLDYNSSATVAVGNQPEGNEAAVNNNVISLFNEAAAAAKQNTAAKQQIKSLHPMAGARNCTATKKAAFLLRPSGPVNTWQNMHTQTKHPASTMARNTKRFGK